MTKSDLISHIAKTSGVSRAKADQIIDTMVQGLIEGLRKDGSATLSGLGIFKLIKRDARRGRNPATGASIDIPAKKVLKFKPSKGVEKEIGGSW